MKRFILQSVIFTLLVMFSALLIFLQADGYSDPYYLRFTSPRQNSLILGNSRAAQGIRPDVLNHELQRDDLYNYSFTLATSPYGQVYLESIKKKLNTTSNAGIFILAVDPWSVSIQLERNQTYPDKNSILASTSVVDLDPNVIYLIRNYDKPYYHLLIDRKSSLHLHEDGWLEVSVKTDSASVEKRMKPKLSDYMKFISTREISEFRLAYLRETIRYLKSKGQVYLVRLPVHPKMMEIEREFAPTFVQLTEKLAKENMVRFFDLTYLNSQVRYTDGNHLERESAAVVSKVIADSIRLNRP